MPASMSGRRRLFTFSYGTFSLATFSLSILVILAASWLICNSAAGQESGRLTTIPKLLSEEELADGWIALFDGHTMFGWHPANKADWKISDGAIQVSSGEKGLLCTSIRFLNYELKADFQAEKGTNSGIFLRTPQLPTDPAKDCYELNIAPSDNPFPTGGLVKRQKAAPVSELTSWQTFHVIVDGGQIRVHLNGKLVCDYIDPQPLPAGYIGLQLNEGRVAFRNIKLKPLRLASLFNGKDLAGWKTYPDLASKFTVTKDQHLNVVNGSGQLETADSFGNFVFQFECISHAANLNSGVFFRCIPGDKMMGYECQIHNGFMNGDRTKPVDCGTGGIFRRQNARIVAADDLKWFGTTLVADGSRMTAWVNGLQVSDWTDTRAADENPRKGLRLNPGTIMIQGHDPTTNLSFRNLRIAKLDD